MAASDQDLVNDMMAHDEFVNYDEPFSEGTPSAPNADLAAKMSSTMKFLLNGVANGELQRVSPHRPSCSDGSHGGADRALGTADGSLSCCVFGVPAKDTGDGMHQLSHMCQAVMVKTVEFQISALSTCSPTAVFIPLVFLAAIPQRVTHLSRVPWLLSPAPDCRNINSHACCISPIPPQLSWLQHSAQCKALCHLHRVPYRPYLSAQFSAAFDVYLEILARVEQSINAVLGRNTPDWRMRNACPACFYKLKDEPPLEFSYLASIDAALRLLNQPAQCRSFKHEVTARALRSRLHNDDWEDVEDPDSSVMHCVERWRNAGSEERKRMFKVFDESGIFIACCRHRFVLTVCDMVQSGELAKYPLAIIDRLLTVYGPDGGLAYDIGCAFATTLANSVLGPRARALNLHLMVGAFHGHAHNRQCQLKWHPIPRTRSHEVHGTPTLSIDIKLLSNILHSGTWTSTFLRNHYREALKAVQTLEAELSVIKNELNLTDDDFRQFYEAEKRYFAELKEPPHEEYLKIRYVEMLNELAECQSVLRFCLTFCA
ncbi:hypothetical protein JVT61DRAFT_12564 [Boletus reticuloceps]|uniref:Uncharacterized protein n=1 Tax=Boletus reticuloceps TaxID=495285 RepID=A0A8I3A2Y8_9AGAM|nr:hypothetical protein JVT61DRAFT_12564 [Boletus reticuloceps]